MIIFIIIALVLALAYLILFHTSLIIMYLDVVGLSMYPTLKDGDKLFSVRSYFCKLREGDIVVARPEYYRGERLVIKRIHRMEYSGYYGDMSYYLLGDNPEESCDSRNYGWVSQNEIVAKVMLRKS